MNTVFVEDITQLRPHFIHHLYLEFCVINILVDIRVNSDRLILFECQVKIDKVLKHIESGPFVL